MLANHTAICQLFDRCVKQYEKLRSRNAFLENYRQEPLFAESLDEFDHAKEALFNPCPFMFEAFFIHFY